jgi:ketose-bisphosphate aldolase
MAKMALVTTREMVREAQRRHYAVPAINTQGGNYYIIRAICFAAEKLKSPVILAHYPSTGAYTGDQWFVEVSKYLAQQVSVPVAIHLDHGDSFATCMRALKYGFTSIMLDCSTESLADNIAYTNEVIKVSQAFGVPVEAEVGELVRLDGSGATSTLENKNIAKVEDVRQFLAGCQPDLLAIGIGNAHGFYKGEPQIRLEILEQVRQNTDIPLVLHGCTGMPDTTVKKAIELGVAKINFGTLVRHKYVEYLKEALDTLDHQGHSWKISQYATTELETVIEKIIELSGSGRRC